MKKSIKNQQIKQKNTQIPKFMNCDVETVEVSAAKWVAFILQ